MNKTFDYIIIGAGIYGLYAAKLLAPQGCKIAVLEYDSEGFQRASYINQARVHNGYHYPRSYSTAIKSARYFERFSKEFEFAIHNKFQKIYAISGKYSLSNAEQFVKFCQNASIPVKAINGDKYFKKDMVEGVFETQEYAFDAFKIRDSLLAELANYNNVELFYNSRIEAVNDDGDHYHLNLNNEREFSTPTVLNATYASVNQLLDLFGLEKFRLKYEICEISLCHVNHALQGAGLTLMDGPFFSVMPFGLDGTYSLTSVTFTPHVTSYADLPTFKCQKDNPECSPGQLANCNTCPARPRTAWTTMQQLAKKYLNPEIELTFDKPLFAIKPIPNASEIDDSRPTIIKESHSQPRFISVLSGKINTMYDLEMILK